MRVVHSLLHPDDLAELVEREYDVPGPVRVRLLHRGFNDTYLVTDSTGERRALRVYTRDKYWIRSTSEVQFELELLEHLAMAGRWVTRPYRRRGGGFLGTVPAPEDGRGYAVFDFAPGIRLGDRPDTPSHGRVPFRARPLPPRPQHPAGHAAGGHRAVCRRAGEAALLRAV